MGTNIEHVHPGAD